jgi:hypothetical protein
VDVWEDTICHVIAVAFQEVHKNGARVTLPMLTDFVESMELPDRTQLAAAPKDWKASVLSLREPH